MDDERAALYEMQAEILKALAHPVRLAIADFLAGGEQCVCDIAERVGAERSNVSHHLALMQQAGVLDSRKDGLRVLYSLRTPCVLHCLTCATEVLRERVERSAAVLREA
jgi:ArsR family transcriptional regulator